MIDWATSWMLMARLVAVTMISSMPKLSSWASAVAAGLIAATTAAASGVILKRVAVKVLDFELGLVIIHPP
ncbi:MAG: hypothetical protein IID59_11765 [Proteobacteria bacterium]|nr:hypothetical protein [Pseudomonadota bacterium]